MLQNNSSAALAQLRPRRAKSIFSLAGPLLERILSPSLLDAPTRVSCRFVCRKFRQCCGPNIAGTGSLAVTTTSAAVPRNEDNKLSDRVPFVDAALAKGHFNLVRWADRKGFRWGPATCPRLVAQFSEHPLAPRVLHVKAVPAVIGRAPAKPRFILPLDSSARINLVSREHAKLMRVTSVADGAPANSYAIRLLDLGSSNGTFVNGNRVTSAILRHGDLIRFGAGHAAQRVAMQSDTTYRFEYPPLHPFTAGASAVASSREPSKTTSPSRGTRRGSLDEGNDEELRKDETTLRRGQKRPGMRSPSPRAAPAPRTRKQTGTDDGDNVISPGTRASSVSSTHHADEEKDGAESSLAKRPRRSAAEVAARRTSLQVKMLDQAPEADEEKEEQSGDAKKRRKEEDKSSKAERAERLSSQSSPSPPASLGPSSHQDTSLSKQRQPILPTDESSSTLELQDNSFLTPVSELLLLPEEQTHTPPQQTWSVGEAVEAKCADTRLPEFNAWFDSTVTADLGNGIYRIHYDNYPANCVEDLSLTRLRPISTGEYPLEAIQEGHVVLCQHRKNHWWYDAKVLHVFGPPDTRRRKFLVRWIDANVPLPAEQETVYETTFARRKPNQPELAQLL